MKARDRLIHSIDAFSLVEVTLALAVVSFPMLSILALLPVGLETLRDSRVDTAVGDIHRQLRAEAVSVPFTNLIDSYYEATISLANSVAPGLTSSASTSMRTLEVTLISPYWASEPQTNLPSIVLANQTGESAEP
jgi:type II secretory pathway pseudopilin PulG